MKKIMVGVVFVIGWLDNKRISAKVCWFVKLSWWKDGWKILLVISFDAKIARDNFSWQIKARLASNVASANKVTSTLHEAFLPLVRFCTAPFATSSVWQPSAMPRGLAFLAWLIFAWGIYPIGLRLHSPICHLSGVTAIGDAEGSSPFPTLVV